MLIYNTHYISLIEIKNLLIFSKIKIFELHADSEEVNISIEDSYKHFKNNVNFYIFIEVYKKKIFY